MFYCVLTGFRNERFGTGLKLLIRYGDAAAGRWQQGGSHHVDGDPNRPFLHNLLWITDEKRLAYINGNVRLACTELL
jgi:hypothetical protein